MEILRVKPNEFRLENFIDYYEGNREELLQEYPHYVSRVCLIDRDYLDVITFDEDYEDIENASDYESLLVNEEYALHFNIGKTDENMEKVELIDGKIYSLINFSDEEYNDSSVKDIGDLNIDISHLIGLLFDIEEDELVVSVVNFEHGGEMGTPRIIEADDSGDLESIIKDILNKFVI